MPSANREIMPPPGWEDGPRCPECGASGARVYRINKRARPIGENWQCVACGTKFVYRTPEQEEFLRQLQEKVSGHA